MKEPMFIPVAVGLLDSSGKDMLLTSIYNEGLLQKFDQPTSTIVLKVTKVGFNFCFICFLGNFIGIYLSCMFHCGTIWM